MTVGQKTLTGAPFSPAGPGGPWGPLRPVRPMGPPGPAAPLSPGEPCRQRTNPIQYSIMWQLTRSQFPAEK